MSDFYLITGIISAGYALHAFLRYHALSGSLLVSAKEAASKDIILDVRTQAEYNSGHVKKAKHVPLTSFSKQKFKNYDKSKSIVVYCRTGNRARMAADMLISYGFKDVSYTDANYTEIDKYVK